MALAEPAIVIALVLGGDASEMGADRRYDQPLFAACLDALGIRLRIAKALPVGVPRLLDLFCGAVADEVWPRQTTLITCPTAIAARSTSSGAPVAKVDASGFICATSGHVAAAAPVAATAAVAILRRSRRVGSTGIAVITFSCLQIAFGNSPASEQAGASFETWDGISGSRKDRLRI